MTPPNKHNDPKKKGKGLPHLSLHGDNKLTDIFLVAAIVVLTAGLHAGSLRNDFIRTWDDHVYLLINDTIRDLSWRNVKTIFSSFYAANYHPLTTLSWAVEYNLFGLNPTVFHATNVVLHLINIVLVFHFASLLTAQRKTAATAALLFAVHPLSVEVVSFVSQRKDLLCALFYLLAMIAYFRYLKTPARVRTRWLAFCLACFVFSLLSKSMAVTLPVILLLLDHYTGRTLCWKRVWEKIPFFALSLVFGIIAVLSQRSYGAIVNLPAFSMVDRFFLVNYAVLFYLVKWVAPFQLSALYGYPPKAENLLPLSCYVAPFVVMGILWAIRRASGFRKDLVFGSLFFLITLAPVLQIIPVGGTLVADRYTYLPYLGLFVIAGQVLSRIVGQGGPVRQRGILAPVFLGVLAALFSYLTWERTKVWADGMTLWSDVIQKRPRVAVARYNRGVARFNSGDFNGAVTDYNDAIALEPSYLQAFFNRGESRQKLDDLEGAQDDFSRVISMDPNHSQAYLKRALVKAGLGDAHGAIRDLDKVIQLTPQDVRGYIERANLKGRQGRFGEVIKDLDHVVALDRNNAKAFNNRGIAKAILKDLEGAKADFTTALRLKPDYDEAKANLARVEKR